MAFKVNSYYLNYNRNNLRWAGYFNVNKNAFVSNGQFKNNLIYIGKVPYFFPLLKAYFSYQYANIDPFDQSYNIIPTFQ